MSLNETHDPTRTRWVESADHSDCDFPIQNLPFGVFEGEDGRGRIGVAIGDQILDLTAAIETEVLVLPEAVACALCSETLNQFMNLGNDAWHTSRVFVARQATRAVANPQRGTRKHA